MTSKGSVVLRLLFCLAALASSAIAQSIRLLACTLLAAMLVAHASAQESPTPQQLLQGANAASDLAATGSYRLEGEVQVFESGKLTGTGHVTIDRDGDSVREEMTFTDYQETAVTTGGKLYLVRKPAVVLPFAWDVRNLDRLWQVTVPTGAAVGQVQPTKAKVDEAPALCFDMKLDKDAKGRMCFTSAPRLLVSHEINSRGTGPLLLFSDYQPFADRYYPATVRSMSGTKPAFEVRNITIKPMQFAADHFSPLPQSIEFRTCRDVQRPRLTSSEDPQYPAMARVAHIQGEVRIYAVIGTDGKLSELRPLRGHPILVQASLDAVRQWRYVPAMCPDGPVATETEIKMKFHM
jgi:TonB family protein